MQRTIQNHLRPSLENFEPISHFSKVTALGSQLVGLLIAHNAAVRKDFGDEDETGLGDEQVGDALEQVNVEHLAVVLDLLEHLVVVAPPERRQRED